MLCNKYICQHTINTSYATDLHFQDTRHLQWGSYFSVITTKGCSWNNEVQ